MAIDRRILFSPHAAYGLPRRTDFAVPAAEVNRRPIGSRSRRVRSPAAQIRSGVLRLSGRFQPFSRLRVDACTLTRPEPSPRVSAIADGTLSGWRLATFGFATALLFVIGLVAAPSSSAQETAYALGPGDLVRVRVHNHEELSGEFRVQPDGTMRLSLIGAVSAEGQYLDNLGETIQTLLVTKAKLRDPHVVTEVVEFRPFFILGDVEKPGEYAYRPGLTVLQAMAMAGGLRIYEGTDLLQLLEATRTRERYEVLRDEYAAFLAARARYLAESEGAEEIDFPIEQMRALSGSERSQELMHREERLLEARQRALQLELSNLKKQQEIARERINALDAQRDSKEVQGELTQEELEAFMRLEAQGLATTARLMSLRRMVAENEGDRRELLAQIAQMRAQIIAIDQTALNVENTRRIEVARELNRLEHDITTQKTRLKRTREALRIAARQLPEMVQVRGPRAGRALTIIRAAAEGPTRIAADEDTRVRPDDTIVVGIPWDDVELGFNDRMGAAFRAGGARTVE